MSLPEVRIPSKTFLFGEYAVLFGGKSYILTHAPYFECGKDFQTSVHAESPAGLFLKQVSQEPSIHLYDPHEKKGGFGRSTAEFISAVASHNKDFSAEKLHQLYLTFFKDSKVKPSGADLVAQALGHPIVFQKEPLSFKKKNWPFQEASLLLCRTKNKINTHDHLNLDLPKIDFQRLIELSVELSKSLLEVNFDQFKEDLILFSLEQNELGLLHFQSKNIMDQLNLREDVYFARGCGALGADVIALLVKKDAVESDFIEDFKDLKLDFICRIDSLG